MILRILKIITCILMVSRIAHGALSLDEIDRSANDVDINHGFLFKLRSEKEKDIQGVIPRDPNNDKWRGSKVRRTEFLANAFENFESSKAEDRAEIIRSLRNLGYIEDYIGEKLIVAALRDSDYSVSYLAISDINLRSEHFSSDVREAIVEVFLENIDDEKIIKKNFSYLQMLAYYLGKSKNKEEIKDFYLSVLEKKSSLLNIIIWNSMTVGFHVSYYPESILDSINSKIEDKIIDYIKSPDVDLSTHTLFTLNADNHPSSINPQDIVDAAFEVFRKSNDSEQQRGCLKLISQYLVYSKRYKEQTEQHVNFNETNKIKVLVEVVLNRSPSSFYEETVRQIAHGILKHIGYIPEDDSFFRYR